MFICIRISLFIFLISFIYCSPVLNTTSPLPLLLLISFDGFRWDYPDLYQLPNFNLLIKRGVRVKYIENTFATVTFPSHFTMITGLYEETHGIVANTIYDPKLNASATIDTMNDTKWWYVFVFAMITSANL
jgi:predicted AlkP superfamily pyrophosphatase or phosphodiesterase